ncbi:MAG: DUF4038 domain-containing protein [Phycisphaerae bacterium]|nr:DUF4038 domain-containing protein [Phycisphaerae bacterium]
MKFLTRAMIVCFCISHALVSPARGQAAVKAWDTFELTLHAERKLDNAYVTSLPDQGPPLVRVRFQGTSGPAQGQGLTIAGFWAGNQTFKARFAPPLPGTWTYESQSSDPGLNGIRGTFECIPWQASDKVENPTRRGFVRVCQSGDRPGRYFEYTDGTPFLWIGDTWWNWTKRGIKLSSFQTLADDRSKKGFTVGQLFFAGRGWGRASSLLDETFTHPDLGRIDQIEQMIRYANSQGLTVWIHPWWGGRDLDQQIGAEAMRRWWRYVIARLGAYNVIWTLAGEYNLYNYGNLGLPFWTDLGAMIDREDPYDRLLSAHPTPPGWGGGQAAPQWSTSAVLHVEPWLNYNRSQVGHGQWRNEMIPQIVSADYARVPARPVVVTEPWYEFVEGNPTAADIRFGALSALLSGAAGHSYAGGHVWKAHVPEAPAGRDTWPMDLSFDTNTLDYPGAVSLGYVARLFRTLPWWQLEPHPELVSDSPAPFCAAVPGHTYVVYLRWGGSLQVDLRPSSEDDTFESTWIDLNALKEINGGQVQGGDTHWFNCPSSYPGTAHINDWLLLIKR